MTAWHENARRTSGPFSTMTSHTQNSRPRSSGSLSSSTRSSTAKKPLLSPRPSRIGISTQMHGAGIRRRSSASSMTSVRVAPSASHMSTSKSKMNCDLCQEARAPREIAMVCAAFESPMASLRPSFMWDSGMSESTIERCASEIGTSDVP